MNHSKSAEPVCWLPSEPLDLHLKTAIEFMDTNSSFTLSALASAGGPSAATELSGRLLITGGHEDGWELEWMVGVCVCELV